MPPKTRKQSKDETMNTFSLQQAHNYINSLANAANSKLNWVNALTTLINFNESGLNIYETDMNKNELYEKYKDVDISPLVSDFDKVQKIVDDKLLSSVSKQPIAIDTKKQTYLAIIRLTQKRSPLQIEKSIREKYVDKLSEIESESNKQRNKNEPKRAVLTYPDFSWQDAESELKQYITSQSFTNTQKGRKALRIACIVSLYVIQRPRRSQDYMLLQWFSRKPTEAEAKDRNILYTEKGKMYFSLDVFKTRYRTVGNAKEKKQQLPRYIKEVNTYLASLLKDYIKKWGIKDMSKLTADEKKKNTQYYIFHLETGNQEQKYDGGFSKYVSSCSEKVFNGRKNITPNTYRHLYNTYIADNLNEFNDNQLQEISIDVGDTPKNMASNLRYRHQNQVNADIEKTQIEGLIRYKKDAIDAMNIQNEEEGSVGDIQEAIPKDKEVNKDSQFVDDVDEIQSPAPISVSSDTELNVLYTKLGKAYMELKSLELMIQRKLSMGV
jgi:hypothetical protein